MRKVLLLLSQSSHFLKCFTVIIKLLRKHEWTSKIELAKALFNWLFVIAAFQKFHKSSNPVLFNQGVFQAIWSLAFRAQPENVFPLSAWIEVTLKLLPDCNLNVLLVIADPSTIDRRLETRTDGQSIMDITYKADALKKAQKIVDDLIEIIESNYLGDKVKLFVYDNDSDGCLDEKIFALTQSLGLVTEVRCP